MCERDFPIYTLITARFRTAVPVPLLLLSQRPAQSPRTLAIKFHVSRVTLIDSAWYLPARRYVLLASRPRLECALHFSHTLHHATEPAPANHCPHLRGLKSARHFAIAFTPRP